MLSTADYDFTSSTESSVFETADLRFHFNGVSSNFGREKSQFITRPEDYTKDRNGIENAAFSLSNNRINLKSKDLLPSLTNGISGSFWVKPLDCNNSTVISRGTPTFDTQQFNMVIGIENGKWVFSTIIDNKLVKVYSEFNATADWTLIHFSWKPQGKQQLRVNGVLTENKAQNASYRSGNVKNQLMVLGGNAWATKGNFSGTIDELEINYHGKN
ncbi:MAG: LamG-like jellyroll fold domain-containing protein [Luteibaculum sp.]